MLSFKETRDIAIQNLSQSDIEVVIVDSIDANEYSVFFFQSKGFIESGNPALQLAGNASLIIDKYGGKIHNCGTAHNSDYYIYKFEQEILPTLR